MEKVPYLGSEVLRWQVGSSTFLAMPEKGARLMHWHVALPDGSYREVIHWPEVDSLDNFAKIRGGNPILFPFAARTYHEGQIHQWRGPDGVVRPMPMHGFARQGQFRLVRCDGRGFTAQLEPDEEAKKAYPFDYEFTVSYRFEGLSLACEFRLQNLGSTPLPWSAGHHFYFAVPWNEGLKRADYELRVPATRRLRSDPATGALHPSPAPAFAETLDAPALLDAIHGGLTQPTLSFGPKGQAERVELRLGTTKTPPPGAVVVTWSAAPDTPYFCVEPWMGPPNSPEHGQGLQWVAPGQAGTFVVEIFVK